MTGRPMTQGATSARSNATSLLTIGPYIRAGFTPFESYRDAEGATHLMEYKAFSAEECV